MTGAKVPSYLLKNSEDDEPNLISAPKEGRLTPLRTKAEVQVSSETTSVYVVEIPTRAASAVLNVLRDVVPPDVIVALQHLRRFARAGYLPPHLVLTQSSTSKEDYASKSVTSHLLVSPTSTIAYSDLQSLFDKEKELFSPLEPTIQQIRVPVFAPTSAAQAAEWSSKYWPTLYKNTNPYGPHPSMVRRAEVELMAGGKADEYMALARRIALECEESGHGCRIGAVVVERGSDGTANESRVVAVAGDARFRGLISDYATPNGTNHTEEGNVMAHAVLRVIAMVADKRLSLEQSEDPGATSPNQQDPASFTSSSLTPLEKKYGFMQSNLKPDGYLCLDLELYLTHEPCIMCAMAILHSRFGRVVFRQSMPHTGALSAEVGSMEYGLFWREQLNWKYLCWQWDSEEGESEMNGELSEGVHV